MIEVERLTNTYERAALSSSTPAMVARDIR
jgi:hypothetical protein